MIDFLKESTFAVNDVINKAWVILYKNYKNITGLCLVMFFVLEMSTSLSSFTVKGVSFVNILGFLTFVLVYLALQLTLFKYILYAVDNEDKEEDTFVHIFVEFVKKKAGWIVIYLVVLVLYLFLMSILSSFLDIDSVTSSLTTVFIALVVSVIRFWNRIKPFFVTLKAFWPESQEFSRFLAALLVTLLTIFLIIVVFGALLLPLVYTGVSDRKVANIALSLGALFGFIALVRISFFPFFIINQGCSAMKAIRFSLAVTRGNFTRLLMLMFLIFLCQIFSKYLQAKEHYFLSLAVSLVYSLIIVPLSSTIIGVAYRNMMSEYTGDQDPDILHNII